MSLSMKATTALLRLYPKALESADSVRAALVNRAEPTPVPDKIRRISTVTSEVIHGRQVITLTPRNPSGKEIIFTHGGAYVNPMTGSHWTIVRWLLKTTHATVTVPDYGLAPEHTATEGYEFLDAVYERVNTRAAGREIYLAGDSAGAGLAFGQALRRRDDHGTAPKAVFLFSPWLDVTMSNSEIWEVLPLDPMLAPGGLIATGQDWAGDLAVDDPLISPINADLADLPPIYVYQGGHDIFLPDTKKLARKASATGAPLELRIYPDGFHVFVAAPWTPEARRALGHVASTINGPEGTT